MSAGAGGGGSGGGGGGDGGMMSMVAMEEAEAGNSYRESIAADQALYTQRQRQLHDAAGERHVDNDVFTPHKRFQTVSAAIDEFCREDSMSESKPPLVIVGEVGSGKSCILANWVRQRRQRARGVSTGAPPEFVFLHIAGCSRDSTTVSNVLFRIVTEIKHHFGLQMEISEREQKLSWEFIRALDTASRKGRVILVIDGLNRLHSTGFAGLKWLPLHFPANVRVIISTTASAAEVQACQQDQAKGSSSFFLTQPANQPRKKRRKNQDKNLAEVMRRKWPTVQVQLLEHQDRAAILRRFLDSQGVSDGGRVDGGGAGVNAAASSRPASAGDDASATASAANGTFMTELVGGDSAAGAGETEATGGVGDEVVDQAAGHGGDAGPNAAGTGALQLLRQQQLRLIDAPCAESPQFLRVTLEALRLAASEGMDVCAVLEDCVGARSLSELYEVILRRWTRGCHAAPASASTDAAALLRVGSDGDAVAAAAAAEAEMRAHARARAAAERQAEAKLKELDEAAGGAAAAAAASAPLQTGGDASAIDMLVDENGSGKEQDADDAPPAVVPLYGGIQVSSANVASTPALAAAVAAASKPGGSGDGLQHSKSAGERVGGSGGKAEEGPSAEAPEELRREASLLGHTQSYHTFVRDQQRRKAGHGGGVGGSSAQLTVLGSGPRAVARESSAEEMRQQARALGGHVPEYLRGGQEVAGLGPILGASLCFLYSSRHGLLEDEMKALLLEEVRMDADAPVRVDDPALFQRLRRLLSTVLGASSVGTMFSLPPLCATLRGLVHRRYLNRGKGLWRVQQALIGYHSRAEVTPRRAEELPWLLERRQSWSQLKDVLLDLEMFEILWTPTHKFDLFRYWGILTGAFRDNGGGDFGGFGGGAGSDVEDAEAKSGGKQDDRDGATERSRRGRRRAADGDGGGGDGSSDSDGGRRSARGHGDIDEGEEGKGSDTDRRQRRGSRQQRRDDSEGDGAGEGGGGGGGGGGGMETMRRVDIVDEYNKAVENWYYSAGRPTVADLQYVLLRIEDFFYHFAEQEGNTPHFVHRPLSESELQGLGIQIRSKAPVRGGAPASAISLSQMQKGHYYYRRWVWMQFPWIALNNCEKVLRAEVEAKAKAADAAGGGMVTNADGLVAMGGVRMTKTQLQRMNRLARPVLSSSPHSLEKSFWAVKKHIPNKPKRSTSPHKYTASVQARLSHSTSVPTLQQLDKEAAYHSRVKPRRFNRTIVGVAGFGRDVEDDAAAPAAATTTGVAGGDDNDAASGNGEAATGAGTGRKAAGKATGKAGTARSGGAGKRTRASSKSKAKSSKAAATSSSSRRGATGTAAATTPSSRRGKAGRNAKGSSTRRPEQDDTPRSLPEPPEPLNLPPNAIPFSQLSNKTLRTGTKCPTVEAMQREDPHNAPPIFHGGITDPKHAMQANTAHVYTSSHNAHRPVHMQGYPVTDLEIEMAQAQTKLQSLRRQYDRLSFTAKERQKELDQLNQRIVEREEQDSYNEACMEAGEAMMLELESRLSKATAAISEASRLQTFYKRVIEVCQRCPAKDGHHLARVEKALQASKLELADKKAHTRSVDFEYRHLQQHERPALEAEVARSTKMRRDIIMRLKKQRARQQRAREALQRRARQRQDIANQVAGDMNTAQEQRLKALTAQQQSYEKQLKTAAEYQRKRIQEYQDAFRRIRAATGIADASQLYSKFIGRDSAVVALTEQRTQYENRLAALRVEKEAAQRELEALQFGDNTITSRYIRQVDEQNFQSEALMNSNKAKYMNARNVMKDVKAGVTHLAHLLGLDDDDIAQRLGSSTERAMGQPAQLDDADIPRLQAIVEERALDLLSNASTRGLSKPGSKRSQRRLGSSSQGQRSRPTTAGVLDDGDGDGDGDGEAGDGNDGAGAGAGGLGDGGDVRFDAADMGVAMPAPGTAALGPAGTFGSDGLGLTMSSGHVSSEELRKPSSADNVFVPSRRRRRAREMALALMPDSDSEEEVSALKELKRRGSIIDIPAAPKPTDDVSATMHRRAGGVRSGIEVPPSMESFDLVQAANYIGMGMGVTMERQQREAEVPVPPGRRVKPRIGVLAPGTIEAVTNKDKVASRTQMKQLSIAVESKHAKKKRNARPDKQQRRPKSSQLSEHH